MNFWRMQQLFSLPAVRSPERAAMEVSAAGRYDAEDPCCGRRKRRLRQNPLQKCVPDITEIPAKDGKLYVSAIFDCCDLLPVGLAVFHELLEQPQDLLVHWRASSCCKAAKILRNDCRCTLRFIILVGNVSSVIDNFNFNMSHVKSPEASALKAAAIQDIEIQKEDITVKFCEGVPIDKETEAYFHLQ